MNEAQQAAIDFLKAHNVKIVPINTTGGVLLSLERMAGEKIESPQNTAFSGTDFLKLKKS